MTAFLDMEPLGLGFREPQGVHNVYWPPAQNRYWEQNAFCVNLLVIFTEKKYSRKFLIKKKMVQNMV